MHSKNIVHRDLKPDNILIEEETRMVKLIDFGFSVVVNGSQGQLKIFCGTPSYMAPEIVRRKESYEGKPVDMWALGVLLYVMLTGQLPFRGANEAELFENIRNGNFLSTFEVFDYSPQAKQTLFRLLETEGRRRIKVEELVETEFVKCNDLKLTVFEMAPTFARLYSERAGFNTRAAQALSKTRTNLKPPRENLTERHHNTISENMSSLDFGSTAVRNSRDSQ